MTTRIDTVASRDKLKPRRGPYWHRLNKGCHVGFRKMTSSGHGSWLARARDEEATVQHVYKPLGEFLELADHLRFDAATKAAHAWFEHLGRGGAAAGATVAEACPDTSRICARTRPTARPTTPKHGSGTTS